MKFIEFSSDVRVDYLINNWLEKESKKGNNIKILDVKFSANGFGSHALVSYMEE